MRTYSPTVPRYLLPVRTHSATGKQTSSCGQSPAEYLRPPITGDSGVAPMQISYYCASALLKTGTDEGGCCAKVQPANYHTRAGGGGQFSRPAAGTRAGDRGAAGRRGDRRPDRRAAVPVGQHGQIAPGADPGQDRCPPARRTGPLHHPGWHRSGRPFRLRACPCWPGATRLRAVNGPFGPHPAHPMGPPGPCGQTPARYTLGLLLRHLGGASRPARRGPEA
jgi:hypothetical protein